MNELLKNMIVESELARRRLKIDESLDNLAPYMAQARQQIEEMQAGINAANEALGYDSGHRIVSTASSQASKMEAPANAESGSNEAPQQKLEGLAKVQAVLEGKIPGKWIEVKEKNAATFKKLFGISLDSLKAARSPSKGGKTTDDREGGIDKVGRIWKYGPNGRISAYFVEPSNLHYDLITPDLFPDW